MQHKIFSSYYDTFCHVTSQLNVDSPWNSKEHFLTEVTGLAFLAATIWGMVSFDLVDQYPRLKDRIVWTARRSIREVPQFWKSK